MTISSSTINGQSGCSYLWIFCPQCGTIHKTRPPREEQRLRCRKCGGIVPVPICSKELPPASETSDELLRRNAAASDKVFWTNCPFCQKQFKLNASMDHDLLQCSACQTVMQAIRAVPASKDTILDPVEPIIQAASPGTGKLQVPTCSYCGVALESSEERIFCEACGLVFHAECWKENMGCTAYGCRMQNCLKAGPDLRIPADAPAIRTSSASNLQGIPMPQPGWQSSEQNVNYVVVRGGQQQGPYRAGEITKMIAAGKLSGNDHCWTGSMANWRPIAEVIPYVQTAIAPPIPSSAVRTYSMGVLAAACAACAAGGYAFCIILFISGLIKDIPASWFVMYLLACGAWAKLHHICWSSIPHSLRWTTPNKAVFLTFVPFYACYWNFMTLIMLSDNLETWGQQHDMRVTTGKALAVAYGVLQICIWISLLACLLIDRFLIWEPYWETVYRIGVYCRMMFSFFCIEILVVGIIYYRGIFNAIARIRTQVDAQSSH